MNSSNLNDKILNFADKLKLQPKTFVATGTITRIIGLTVEAIGCKTPIGSYCHIVNNNDELIPAKTVGFEDNKIYLMLMGETSGIEPGAKVLPTGQVAEVGVGDHLLGRVIDGTGKPLDNLGPINYTEYRNLSGERINPLNRKLITETLDVGIRVINGLLTIGKGQRIGIFSGSGVGKSVLLGMMSRFTRADVVVIGLIGERGREVKEFIDKNLGPQGLKKSVVVAAPADDSPLNRLHGAWYATAIAEYFRDKGQDVLLLMDSLTRFAQAQREISLAIGEMPANKGYTPSVFAQLPKLVERAGMGNKSGSITAFYTVLAEGDDEQDPIVDSARAILDGHILLSRELAGLGHYPAIDIETSISRVMAEIVPPEQLSSAVKFKRLFSTYRQNVDLLNVGAYVAGQNPELDYAIAKNSTMQKYLLQDMHEQVDEGQAKIELAKLFDDAN
jgi:flagellum-specific ATP synthase